MISNRKELKEYISCDNKEYLMLPVKAKIEAAICKYPNYEIMKFKKLLRYAEYYFNTLNNSKIRLLKAYYYERKKNKLGYKLGIEIDINTFGKGLIIHHGGNIVVNPSARCGENCQLHGGNCIGNNGKTDVNPVIGNNVDIGFGACIIGDVKIADNVKIGSNAVVVKSCESHGCSLVGVPARIIKKENG